MQALVGCQNGNYSLHLLLMDVIGKIGKQIKIARISSDPEISTEKLAEIVGVTRQTINNIEGGRTPGVSFLVILSIAKALGMSLSELVHDNAITANSVSESVVEYISSHPRDSSKKNGESVRKSASERVPGHHKKAG